MRWVDALLESHPQCADFYCPLTKVVMYDPVIAEDGITYERTAIDRYLMANDTSPVMRSGAAGFVHIGKKLTPNIQRKAALDRILRDFNHEDEPEVLEWDPQGLQEYLPAPRSVALASPMTVVPPPTASPRAVADTTSDLTKMFAVLDPLRAELNTLVSLTPPKIVVIGDESSGKSTVLEQLIRMPLFPRNKTFCTRLPIHVRLRRPDVACDEQACVTMSVITAEGYRNHSYDAEPEEPPCTIATASGYHFVQDRMSELSSRLAGETGGIVSDRIIVLDVLHPEVPVLDLIDLPGIVSVDVPGVTPPGKVAAVERVISEQIDADREHGLTSFYLVVVPSVRPNCSNTFKLIQREGLLDHAIGVLTKCDEIKNDRDLLAWIKGEDVEDEDDGTIHTAAELGQVALPKGWTATMLEMPKCTVVADGKKVNYYAVHAMERLKKQEEAEKRFFRGDNAKDVMRTLYDEGYAGTGALASKLTFEYFEYSRGGWLRKTLARLLEYELQLCSERVLLGTTDHATMDDLATREVETILDDGAGALTARFVNDVLLPDHGLFRAVDAAIDEIDGTGHCAHEVDARIEALQRSIQERVAEAVAAVKTFHADEMQRMLNAPVRATPWGKERGVEGKTEKEAHAPFSNSGKLAARWYVVGAAEQLVRVLFGASEVPARSVELHTHVITTPIIQLGAYPEFTNAIASAVRDECTVRSQRIKDATEAVIAHLGAQVSQYIHLVPYERLDGAQFHFKRSESTGHYAITDALKVAILRHLPHAERLKAVVAEKMKLKVSSFQEDEHTSRTRRELDGRLARVRDVIRGLVRALDVDKSKPLDGMWLAALQLEHGLPVDDQVLYTDTEIARARANFEAFHRLTSGDATVLQLQRSSAKIAGWMLASHSSMATLAADAAAAVQAAARGRAARGRGARRSKEGAGG